MIGKKLLSGWVGKAGMVLFALLGSAHVASAQGQGESTIPADTRLEYSLAKPTVFKPKNVTESGFVASWRNVPKSEKDVKILSYRLHVTHEFEAKEDGVYPVGNAVIKGADKETSIGETLGSMAWLDGYVSQDAWWGSGLKALPGAIRVDAAALPSNIVDEMIVHFARIISPIYDLQNNNGEFTLKFKAKVASGSTAANLTVYGYGDEAPPKKIEDVKTVVVPADGKEHEFSLTFKNGTWCHTLFIGLTNRVSVDFVDAFKVEQTLKKGDKGFRSVMRGAFTEDNLLQSNVVDPAYPFSTVYTREIGGLTKNALDVELAKQNGERVAYRMLAELVLKNNKTYVYRSLYSEPAYFDNLPSEENKYLYVGYCDYEDPNYNFAYPGSVPEGQQAYVAAAIKATSALLKDYKGAKVVGLRFCVAASTQESTGHKFTPVVWKPEIPGIFLAERLRTYKDEDYTEESKTKFITYKSATFHDGWNTVLFDQPYTIEEGKEFYAGAFLYDTSATGKTFVMGRRMDDVTKSPDAFMWSYNTSGGEQGFMPFFRPGTDQAVLIQLVIESDSPHFQNRATVDDLAPEVLYYDNEPVMLSSVLKNEGIKAIESIDIKVSMAGEEVAKTITFSPAVPTTSSQLFTFKAFEKLTKVGETDVKLLLTKINGIAVEGQTEQVAKTKIVDHTKVFPRTIMVELFTTESCNNCPEYESFFLSRFDKPEFKEIKDRTVFVAHHTGSVGDDFLTHGYSKNLAPFYGAENKSGQIKFRAAFTPAGMINRTLNPFFSTRDPKAPVSGISITETAFINSFNHAVYRDPAYGRLGLKESYDDAKKQLTVDIEGEISELIDPKRPVYVSIMLVQDAIKARAQRNGEKIDPNYVHHNVFRYIDDANFQGIPVQIDANRKFTISKTIDLKAVGLGEKPTDNALLLEDGEGASIELKDLMANGVQVIAFLHHSATLPTMNDVEVGDPRFAQNEIINVASNRLKTPEKLFPDQKIDAIDAPEVAVAQEIFYVQNRMVQVNSAYNDLRVFAIDGTIVRNENLPEGSYVVRAVLANGKVVSAKVVVR